MSEEILNNARYNKLYHPVKIGDVQLDGNLFLAPVAGYSDRAFRFLCRQGGANFAYTEMVSAEALVRSSCKTHSLMMRAPNEDVYAVQIFGGDAICMKEAVSIVLERTHAEVIDINAGCPVPKIVKSNAGSMLTKEPERLYAITDAVVQGAKDFATKNNTRCVPVTVKIRSGWDATNLTWRNAADAAYRAGASAITLHPRTRAQGYEGKADWSLIAKLVDFLGDKVPIFASGDIFSPKDAKAVLEQTNCHGVMFARGSMGNPFIFDETRRFLLDGVAYTTPPQKRISAGLQELDLLIADKGEEVACKEMRKRFCAYSKGLEHAAKLRPRIVQACTKDDFVRIFAPFCNG